jgi:hypothetical protein
LPGIIINNFAAFNYAISAFAERTHRVCVYFLLIDKARVTHNHSPVLLQKWKERIIIANTNLKIRSCNAVADEITSQTGKTGQKVERIVNSLNIEAQKIPHC